MKKQFESPTLRMVKMQGGQLLAGSGGSSSNLGGSSQKLIPGSNLNPSTGSAKFSNTSFDF